MCAAAIKRWVGTPSAEGTASLVQAQADWCLLLSDPRVLATEIKNEKVWEKFAAFAMELGCPQPLLATPGIVSAFLLHSLRVAKKAKMRSHTDACPNFRLPATAPRRGPLPGGGLCLSYSPTVTIRGVD